MKCIQSYVPCPRSRPPNDRGRRSARGYISVCDLVARSVGSRRGPLRVKSSPPWWRPGRRHSASVFPRHTWNYTKNKRRSCNGQSVIRHVLKSFRQPEFCGMHVAPAKAKWDRQTDGQTKWSLCGALLRWCHNKSRFYLVLPTWCVHCNEIKGDCHLLTTEQVDPEWVHKG